MASAVRIEIEVPQELALFRLPDDVRERLTSLLSKQNDGQPLTDPERREAEGLADLADLFLLYCACAPSGSAVAPDDAETCPGTRAAPGRRTRAPEVRVHRSSAC